MYPDEPQWLFPWIRWPVLIPVVVFAGFAVVFGGIAALAVFASGSNDFLPALAVCAGLGGAGFAFGYFIAIGPEVGWRNYPSWLFSKRPPRAGNPDPIPGPAAGEGSAPRRVPGEGLPASPDTGRDSGGSALRRRPNQR